MDVLLIMSRQQYLHKTLPHNEQTDFCFLTRHFLVGQGLLTVDAAGSYSDTPHSIGLLWTSDQPDGETAT